MQIITLTPNHTQQYWNLLNALDYETPFMMYEPGERSPNLSRLNALLSTPKTDAIVFAVEHNEELVGFLSASRGAHLRTRHSAYVVCGVRQNYRRQGLGTQLFQYLDRWAIQQHIHRLELTVMCENIPAINLYLKSGFQIEGTARHTMRVGDSYKDEYHMSKIYPEES